MINEFTISYLGSVMGGMMENPAFGTFKELSHFLSEKQGFHFLSPIMSPLLALFLPNLIMEEQQPEPSKKPYTPARYVNAKGKKYIQFSIWNEDTKKLERIRDYRINKYVGTPQLREIRAKLIREINELLINGAYKSSQQIEVKRKKVLSVRDAFEQAIKIKKGSLRDNSYKDYKSCKKLLLEFFEKKEPEVLSLPITKLTNQHLMNYFEYLQVEEICQPVTINNRKTYIITLLNDLVDYEYIKENPLTNRKLLREDEIKTHAIFTDEHFNKIKEYLERHNTQLLQFIFVMMYTFARRNELRQLQVKHINLERSIGHVPANLSKNRCPRNFEIMQPLHEVLTGMSIEKADPEYFLFGKEGKPGPKKYGRNYFSIKFKEMRDKLNLPKSYTLYSSKHYGVTKHFISGYDIRWLQDQAGFQDMETIEKYLRSLSLKIARNKNLSPPQF